MSETIAEQEHAVVRPEEREMIELPQDRLIDSVTASQQEVIDSVELAGTAVVEGLGLAHRAFADFVAERIRQDFATQRALLRSRSLEEARTIGFAHVRTTVDQYGRRGVAHGPAGDDRRPPQPRAAASRGPATPGRPRSLAGAVRPQLTVLPVAGPPGHGHPQDRGAHMAESTTTTPPKTRRTRRRPPFLRRPPRRLPRPARRRPRAPRISAGPPRRRRFPPRSAPPR